MVAGIIILLQSIHSYMNNRTNACSRNRLEDMLPTQSRMRFWNILANAQNVSAVSTSVSGVSGLTTKLAHRAMGSSI